MDCAPLSVLNAEDLSQALSYMALIAFVSGVLGVFIAQGVAAAIRMVGRWIRLRGQQVPFARRVEHVRVMRERMFLALDRVAERQARQAARRGCDVGA
ncbi:hypothetical protein [Xenophilus azovorans]|uniref:hypothetical protein n=1 Tax=Xenophilus azovorans TaxID=151755 RepID=UPI00057144C1|nr:hypothetical protein [Xenophilus azovorans]